MDLTIPARGGLLGISLIIVALPPSPVSGDTFVVTKLEDEDGPCVPGDCALREAVLAANALPGRDVIEVPAGIYQLSLIGPVDENFSMTGDLDIRDDVELRGDPTGRTIIVGDGTDRVIQAFNPGLEVEISRVVLTGGVARNGGGGLRSTAETLLLRDCAIVDNTTIAGDGGGLFIGTISTGAVRVEDCQVGANSAPNGRGGGVYLTGGGVFSSTDLVNLTISDNAALFGGGIFAFGMKNTTLNHLTIADNRGDLVDGFFGDLLGFGAVTFENTLFWNNDCGYLASGLPVSNGHNVEGPNATCFFPLDGDLMSVADMRLGPLGDHGGFSETHSLLPGSPAIDAALADDCPATDQRGRNRPLDGDADGSADCDAGAYEADALGVVDIPALRIHGTLLFVLLLGVAGVAALARRGSPWK